jgi:polar amino acid transport system permease protein
MSGPAARGATTADRHEQRRTTLWAGAAALIAAVAIGFGWRSDRVPEPLMEVLSYVCSGFLLDGALTAIEIAALAMVGGMIWV